jgi:uncharacterized protein
MRPAPAHYPQRAPIDAYGNGGFRFAGMSHRGSVMVLPSGIYAWDVKSLDDVTADACAAFLREVKTPGFVLLGAGPAHAFPSSDVRKLFAEARIGLEPMSTGAAARTFNVLLAEGRDVSAGLIAVE